MKNIFYQLIEEQTKSLMLAELSDEYVFKVISEPKVTEEKVEPKRAIIAIFGFVLGNIFAGMFVFLKYICMAIKRASNQC